MNPLFPFSRLPRLVPVIALAVATLSLQAQTGLPASFGIFPAEQAALGQSVFQQGELAHGQLAGAKTFWPFPASGTALAGIQLASAGGAGTALQEPLLVLYQRLLVANRGATASWEMQRLQAWVNNGSRPRQLVEVGVGELLSLELDQLHTHALSDTQLRELGVSDSTIGGLPALPGLIDSVKQAMMALPEGIQELPDVMALAVLGNGDDASDVVALVLRAP
jgi:hypothetical protein